MYGYSSSGADVAHHIEIDKHIQNAERARYAEKKAGDELAIKDAAELANGLQRKVYLSSNPSPLFMTIIVLVVICAIYYIWILYGSPTLTGKWVDSSSNKTFNITHDKVNKTYTAESSTDDSPKQLSTQLSNVNTVNGNMINADGKLGLWDLSDTVWWIDGGTMKRIISA